MTSFTDPDPSTYVPPPHRIAAIGDAWHTAVERITTVDDGPETVNERLSDGGPGPDGQPVTVRERLSDGSALEGEPVDGDEPKKSAPRKRKG